MCSDVCLAPHQTDLLTHETLWQLINSPYLITPSAKLSLIDDYFVGGFLLFTELVIYEDFHSHVIRNPVIQS